MVKLTLEFSGGLELLFGGKKAQQVDVPMPSGAAQPAAEVKQELQVGQLLAWIRENLVEERPEMFMKGDSVRPGILVLVNESDWELSGKLQSLLEDGDTVVFISTLHGG
eukprot:TRINITY_DN14268_c0_g1_i1.p1 TRINITY_DN14268_c0_g1~~TRINITY_DN14268_c0_g1_i1.p1  ORF type:complete len:109 (-),score=27.12 TRINITY_DN14268_c0_g1_i1:715-1041(-)